VRVEENKKGDLNIVRPTLAELRINWAYPKKALVVTETNETPLAQKTKSSTNDDEGLCIEDRWQRVFRCAITVG